MLLFSRLFTATLVQCDQDLGELERAKEYHILAMEIEKEKLGPQHVGFATTYSNLGTVYQGT